jgi:hypothetical protein
MTVPEGLIEKYEEDMTEAAQRAYITLKDAEQEIEHIRRELDKALGGEDHEAIGEVRGPQPGVIFEAFGAARRYVELLGYQASESKD